TLRIERTTQQMVALSSFAGFAPWLIEEARKQSREPLAAAAKVEAKDEATNQEAKSDSEANAPAQSSTDVHLGIVQKNSVSEGSERNEWRLVSVRSAKPGWLHL